MSENMRDVVTELLNRLIDVSHDVAAEDCPYVAGPDQPILAGLRDGWFQGRNRALSVMQGAICGMLSAAEDSNAALSGGQDTRRLDALEKHGGEFCQRDGWWDGFDEDGESTVNAETIRDLADAIIAAQPSEAPAPKGGPGPQGDDCGDSDEEEKPYNACDCCGTSMIDDTEIGCGTCYPCQAEIARLSEEAPDEP